MSDSRGAGASRIEDPFDEVFSLDADAFEGGAQEPKKGGATPPRTLRSKNDSELSEAAWLGAVLLAPDLWDACGDDAPLPQEFSSSELADMARFATELRLRGIKPDAVELYRHMLERSTAPVSLAAIQQVVESAVSVTPSVVRGHAQRIRRDARLRSIAAAAGAAYQEALAPDGRSPEEVMGRVLAHVLGGLVEGGHRSARDIAEVMLDEVAAIDEIIANGKPVGWSTGICDLDRLLCGGFRPGSLVVIAARPGVGKSSFAMQMAVRQALDGRRAAFLSLEMPAAEQGRRVLAHVGRVDYGALQAARNDDIDWAALADAVERMGRCAGLWVDDQSGPDVAAITRKVEALAAIGTKLLVLDYLQLCSVPGKQSRTAEIGEITRTLKNLAKKHGMAILCLSQLNRDVEKRVSPRPTMADLRDSGEIEQDADVVIFLWRDRPEEREEDGPVQIGCALDKNRQGVRGAFALTFSGRYQHFGSSTEPLRDRSAQGAGRGSA